MLLFLLKTCTKKQYNAIKEILNSDKFALITSKPQEGVISEIHENLSYEELFELYRKYRKKYFKLKNIYERN
ncbi:MAG: hypothetical protein ACOCV1_04125 [Bacillota bacterium]